MAHSDMGVCRSCGRQIKWIRMQSGKAMPVDPSWVWYNAKEGGPERLVTEDGTIVTARRAYDPYQADGHGYISHFATCPAAAANRKRG